MSDIENNILWVHNNKLPMIIWRWPWGIPQTPSQRDDCATLARQEGLGGKETKEKEKRKCWVKVPLHLYKSPSSLSLRSSHVACMYTLILLAFPPWSLISERSLEKQQVYWISMVEMVEKSYKAVRTAKHRVHPMRNLGNDLLPTSLKSLIIIICLAKPIDSQNMALFFSRIFSYNGFHFKQSPVRVEHKNFLTFAIRKYASKASTTNH